MKIKNLFSVFVIFVLLALMIPNVLAVQYVNGEDGKPLQGIDVADLEPTTVIFKEEKNLELADLGFWNKVKYTFRSFNFLSSLDNIDGRPCDDEVSVRTDIGPVTNNIWLGQYGFPSSYYGTLVWYTCPSDNYGCVVQLWYDDDCDGSGDFSDEYRVLGGQPAGLIPAGDGTYYAHWFTLQGECSWIDSYECNEAEEELTCEETDDGDDPWEYGTMEYCVGDDCYGPLEDYCIDSNYVFERWCDETNSPNSRQRACIDGYCEGGECKPDVPPEECDDTDGGEFDYTHYGEVTYAGNTFKDSCSGKILTENFCDGGVRDFATYTCPEDCSGGKCVGTVTTPFCTESGDSGLDWNTAGQVETEDGIFVDECDGNILTEWECNEDEKNSETHTCADGCSGGKCLVEGDSAIDLYDVEAPTKVTKGQQFDIVGYGRLTGTCDGCVIETGIDYYGEPASASLSTIDMYSEDGVCGDDRTVGVKLGTDVGDGDIIAFTLSDTASLVGTFDVPVLAVSKCWEEEPQGNTRFDTETVRIIVEAYEPTELTCYWCNGDNEMSETYEDYEDCPGESMTEDEFDDEYPDGCEDTGSTITCYWCDGTEEKQATYNADECIGNVYDEDDFDDTYPDGCEENVVPCYYCGNDGTLETVYKESCDITGLTDDENLKCGEDEDDECESDPYSEACRIDYCKAHPTASICKVDCESDPTNSACKQPIDTMWYYIGGGFVFFLLLIFILTGKSSGGNRGRGWRR